MQPQIVTPQELMLLHFNEARANTVMFRVDTLESKNTQMNAKDFKLPFKMMHFRLNKTYKVDDIFLTNFRIAFLIDSFVITSTELKDSIRFEVLESGELVLKTVDASGFKNKSAEELKTISKNVLQGNIPISSILPDEVLNREKHYYNLVYDIVATIDYLNSSEYVVTKHTTTTAPDGSIKKLPSGMIETRIKIKHVKKIYKDSQVRHHEGSKHRYKYRVRGHWRQQEGAEKVWIKDHVRGGDGSIFIPKEYEIV